MPRFVQVVTNVYSQLLQCMRVLLCVLFLQLILIRSQIRNLIVHQAVTERHGKAPYLVVSLHQNKDRYLQVTDNTLLNTLA